RLLVRRRQRAPYVGILGAREPGRAGVGRPRWESATGVIGALAGGAWSPTTAEPVGDHWCRRVVACWGAGEAAIVRPGICAGLGGRGSRGGGPRRSGGRVGGARVTGGGSSRPLR